MPAPGRALDVAHCQPRVGIALQVSRRGRIVALGPAERDALFEHRKRLLVMALFGRQHRDLVLRLDRQSPIPGVFQQRKGFVVHLAGGGELVCRVIHDPGSAQRLGDQQRILQASGGRDAGVRESSALDVVRLPQCEPSRKVERSRSSRSLHLRSVEQVEQESPGARVVAVFEVGHLDGQLEPFVVCVFSSPGDRGPEVGGLSRFCRRLDVGLEPGFVKLVVLSAHRIEVT